MPRQSMNLLRSYRYDPLDRLVACATSGQASTQRFYLRDRLATEIQGTVQHSIMQHDDHLLAQQQRQRSAAAQTSLLATDQQRSVLTLLDTKQPRAFAYMSYGYCFAGSGLLSLLGFNGERPDPVTGWYLLGTGHHRPFNPVLMRFNCPDSWSPFGDGGLNAYSYCEGDPRNRSDSTGHASLSSLISSLSSFIENLKFKKISPPVLKKNRVPASKDFLEGKYKKTEPHTPDRSLPMSKPDQDRNLMVGKNEKDLARYTNATTNKIDAQAAVSADPLNARLKALLNRYDPLKNTSPEEPLRKVIATIDKALLEEQLNNNRSIFRNPQPVMQSIRNL